MHIVNYVHAKLSQKAKKKGGWALTPVTSNNKGQQKQPKRNVATKCNQNKTRVQKKKKERNCKKAVELGNPASKR